MVSEKAMRTDWSLMEKHILKGWYTKNAKFPFPFWCLKRGSAFSATPLSGTALTSVPVTKRKFAGICRTATSISSSLQEIPCRLFWSVLPTSQVDQCCCRNGHMAWRLSISTMPINLKSCENRGKIPRVGISLWYHQLGTRLDVQRIRFFYKEKVEHRSVLHLRLGQGQAAGRLLFLCSAQKIRI